MAITSAGYAGTVNDLQWAQLSRYMGQPYAVKQAADLACTQSGVTKTFDVAAGEFYGRGIMDANSASLNVAPTVPGSGGQWSLIVAHRVWATKLTTIIAIAGATTSASVPTAPPTAYPTLSTTPGTADDQPLFWVWVNASNTTTVIFDARVFAPGMVADLNALPPVTNYSEGSRLHVDELNCDFEQQDGVWVQVSDASATDAAARDAAYLKAASAYTVQGARCALTSLGYKTEYYGLFNASTNKGGRTTAGWKAVGVTNVPISPTFNVVSGTSAALGPNGSLILNAVSTLDVVFATDDFENFRCESELAAPSGSPAAQFAQFLTAMGTPETGNLYYRAGYYFDTSSITHDIGATTQPSMDIGFTYALRMDNIWDFYNMRRAEPSRLRVGSVTMGQEVVRANGLNNNNTHVGVRFLFALPVSGVMYFMGKVAK